MGASQWRHLPRWSANETSGTFSYHASWLSHDMQTERGRTTERLIGMRAATTFRKLPTASPGASAIAASSTFILRGLRRARPECGPEGGRQSVAVVFRALRRSLLLYLLLLQRPLERDHEVVPVRCRVRRHV